jgi:hypothetical protein
MIQIGKRAAFFVFAGTDRQRISGMQVLHIVFYNGAGSVSDINGMRKCTMENEQEE